MKKVLAVVLSLCMLIGLTACGAPIKVKKFSSEEEMKAYIQGVWGYAFDLVFIDGEYLYHEYEGADRRVEYFEDSLVDTVKEQGAEGVSQLVVKNYLAEVEKDWLTPGNGYPLQFNYKKGTITYGEDETIYVGEGFIYSDVEMEKISDTPSYTCDELIGRFEEVYKNFKPTTSMYLLTAEEYEEKLQNLYPKANITRDGSSVNLLQVTTDPNYTTTLEIEYDAAKGTLTATYTPHIRDYIYNLAHAAVLALGKAPNAPDNIELVEYFDTNKVSNNENPDPNIPSWWIYRYEAVMPVDDLEIKVSSFSDINSTSWYKITIAPLAED